MNHIILLVISMLAFLGGSITKKIITVKYENNKAVLYCYNAVTSVVATLMLIMLGNISKISLFTVILALAFGLITAIQAISHMKALEIGTFSYTSVIVALSMLIPTISGALFWNERIYLVQIVGIVLMVVCFILATDFSEGKKKQSVKWLLYCGIAFLLTGAIGVMQKWHQNTAYRNELDAFLVIAFACSFIYSAIFYGILTYKTAREELINEKYRIDKKVILLMVLGGICIALNNKLNLYLSGVMESAIFFPVVNGGGLILNTLVALLFFRERISSKQWIGILVGIISVVFLCNPFT